MEELKKRLEELKEQIRENDYQYYVLDDPQISDYEYDKLMQELLDIEKAHPELLTADSPSQRVGGEALSEFPPYTHRNPLLSLGNSYNEEDLREFDRRVKSDLGVAVSYTHLAPNQCCLTRRPAKILCRFRKTPDFHCGG